MSETPEHGTWDDVFGAADPRLAEIAGAARAAIKRRHPGAVEVARPGERSVSFGLGAAKMSEAYAYLTAQRAWVNLGFFQGTALPDPAGLMEGTGDRLRHVKLRDAAEIENPALVDLIDAAIAERARALGREV
ncbi:MAG: hypothetical protein ACFBWO_08515 [Paracoccaceae bacterium]